MALVKRSNRLSKAPSSAQALGLTSKELREFSRADMAKIVSSIASAANKRITRMEKAGQPITDTVQKFSVAGKTRNELMKEFRRVKDFMQAETLSLRGQRIVGTKTARGIAGALAGVGSGKEFKKKLKEVSSAMGTPGSSQHDTFWRTYERLKETSPIIANKQYKYRVLGEQIKIMNNNPNISADELQARMQSELNRIYEETQEEETPTDVFTPGIK